MIGRKSIVGLSLLSALVFCGLIAQSAMAEFEPAKKLTAYTCAPAAEGEFSDAHCDHFVGKPGGSFSHEVIAKNVITALTATNEGTASETTASTPAVLKSTIAGVTTTLTAGKVHTDDESFIENTEPEAGVHKVKGTVRITYSEVTVTGPAHCGVVEPIEFHTLFEDVEEGAKMGLKFTPATGEAFTSITYTGAECALNGVTITIKGAMIATGLGAEGEKHGSGATLIFKPEDESLKIGTKAMSLEQTLTTRMVGGNPIALTTAT